MSMLAEFEGKTTRTIGYKQAGVKCKPPAVSAGRFIKMFVIFHFLPNSNEPINQ